MRKYKKSIIVIQVLLVILQFIISYIKYFFLTGLVIFSLFALLFIILNIKPSFSFAFLKYFSFIDPLYKTGSFTLDINQIMQVFLAISFITTIILSFIKIVCKKLFKLELGLSKNMKASLLLRIISFLYILALLFIAFDNNLDKGLFFVLIGFYFIDIFCMLGYLIFNSLLTKLNKL